MYKKVSLSIIACLVILLLGSNKCLSQAKRVPAKEIKMTVLPGLRFDVPRFHVQPGQQVHINFENTDDMDHNLLVLKPGTREQIVNLAAKLGAQGMAKSYVPESSSILWHTKILHGGQKERLSFTAPKEEGIYPYVCTFPGHGHVMYGAMYVSKVEKLPELAHDPNIPKQSSHSDHQQHQHKNHPYELVPPYYYRLYIEGASPAAIAVHLPGQLSYCWDASLSDLRFLWKGEFVDNAALWKGHKDAKAKILGDIFYQEKRLPSLSLLGVNSIVKRKFKGYKVLKDKYLEFHYQLNELDIYETIRETPDRKGIVRSFRIPKLSSDLQFNYTKTDGVQCFFKGKPLTTETLKLSSSEGRVFSVEYKINK
ncbi:hypothetical protein GQF61_11680 [Sphingobacterium sp. DK4209]|uniref:Blue (type 1) copper domain-containing protein n=1 Tax=Sphingobacterium zhuxiongii TaxID=2662364 RepID=A0A5Q0QDB5_9SPHI|nr:MULTISPECIES: plastocyanin/azurin family copper-binding protein [unclassified Sphingobacterium]MVZ66521.1 hypothetical protein [Sphingobacterium sp. DK4209]QGA27825.1 hypothetical protein GFH32_16510 [Sphingobacterium sp. dk4302]